MKAVLSPLARATLNTSTAHSAVISGSLYDEPTSLAPWRRASRTRPSGVTSLGSTPAAPPRPHQAAVAAGQAAHGAALDLLDHISCPHTRVQGLGERGGAAVGSVVGQKGDDAPLRHGWALPGIYAGPELAEGPRRELIE